VVKDPFQKKSTDFSLKIKKFIDVVLDSTWQLILKKLIINNYITL
jgi:hypothetical protein